MTLPRTGGGDCPSISADVVPLVDLLAQYDEIGFELKSAAESSLAECDHILGRQVQDFEFAFAHFLSVDHAVGVASGLDALRLALVALGVGLGDEVILPVNTFIATALAVSSVGAKPVLVDCDPRTYHIDPNAIEAALTPRTRAIMPVHLTGLAVDMAPIMTIAKRHDLLVVEDAAQAHGAQFKGKPCGSIGHAAGFSFYPGKNLGAAGDGGAITTGDPVVATKLRCLRNYGQRSKYDHVIQGFNSRLDTMQAALLLVKLRHLSRWNALRVEHAAHYRALLRGSGDLGFQAVAPDTTHVYHLFVVESDRRDALQEHLRQSGIQTGIHYPKPIHLQVAYAELGHRPGDFPNAEGLSRRMLSLPMYPQLKPAQIERVAGAVRAFFDR